MAAPDAVVAQVLSDLLAESREDFVEVWSVLWQVRYWLCDGDYPIDVYERTDPAEVRLLALGVIEAALGRGVRAGFYVDARPGEYPPPFSAAPPAAVMARLLAGWEQLGREPSMAELAGFATRQHPTPNPIIALIVKPPVLRRRQIPRSSGTASA